MITKALIWANVLAFAWLVLGAGFHAIDGSVTNLFYYQHGALLGVAVQSGQWWRIFTGAFLHGSLIHIAVNMWALYIVGRDVERAMGPVRYLLLYFLAALGSGIAVTYFSATQVTVGASGAIFGLFGALVAIGLSLPPRGMTIVTQTLPVIGVNLAFGLLVPGISNSGHVGGLISGFIAGWLLFQIPSARRAALDALINGHVHARVVASGEPDAVPFDPREHQHVETIEHPPDAGPHEEAGAPPLEVRDPRE
ncbi:MAG: rhomboid family intrarane serine protease [Candidatus Eremiobacteraeota bacterium]|nr:rhomboid family intrarane serine protease [Candidatus Eremiobacteraeota bacterium]